MGRGSETQLKIEMKQPRWITGSGWVVSTSTLYIYSYWYSPLDFIHNKHGSALLIPLVYRVNTLTIPPVCALHRPTVPSPPPPPVPVSTLTPYIYIIHDSEESDISVTCNITHGHLYFIICKRCLFECDIGKYSTCPKVWAFTRTPYPLNMCCISQHSNMQHAVFPNIARKINNVCIFSHE